MCEEYTATGVLVDLEETLVIAKSIVKRLNNVVMR